MSHRLGPGKLVIASHNAGKVREIRELLGPYGIEPVSAAEALQLGLVNRVVPLDALEGETSRLAKRLASGAPVAQARIKALMRQSLDTSYGEQLDAEEQRAREAA